MENFKLDLKKQQFFFCWLWRKLCLFFED